MPEGKIDEDGTKRECKGGKERNDETAVAARRW